MKGRGEKREGKASSRAYIKDTLVQKKEVNKEGLEEEWRRNCKENRTIRKCRMR
jgi:hypothetical protein